MASDEENWKRDLKQAEEIWNEAFKELANFGEMHMALPLVNAISEGAVRQARSLKSTSDALLIAGEKQEDVTEFIRESLSTMHAIIFYSGYLLGKRGVELEKVQCIHEVGREN